jgi:hypothetical protein
MTHGRSFPQFLIFIQPASHLILRNSKVHWRVLLKLAMTHGRFFPQLLIFIQPASHLILRNSKVHWRVLLKLAIGSSIVPNQLISCLHTQLLPSKTCLKQNANGAWHYSIWEGLPFNTGTFTPNLSFQPFFFFAFLCFLIYISVLSFIASCFLRLLSFQYSIKVFCRFVLNGRP